MTANRNLKQRVRARAQKTGESYTAARHAAGRHGPRSVTVAAAQLPLLPDPGDASQIRASGTAVRALMRARPAPAAPPGPLPRRRADHPGRARPALVFTAAGVRFGCALGMETPLPRNCSPPHEHTGRSTVSCLSTHGRALEIPRHLRRRGRAATPPPTPCGSATSAPPRMTRHAAGCALPGASDLAAGASALRGALDRYVLAAE